MDVRSTQRYLHLAKACLDVAERATPNDREKLHRIAETWLRLASDKITKVSAETKRARARSVYLEDLQQD
jgi:hypothetical protein